MKEIKNEYVSIRQFDNLVRLAAGQPAEQCGMNGHCTYQTVVEANGNLYPCDFFCNDTLCLGNIKTTDFFKIDKNKVALEFIKNSFIIPNRCKSCNYYKLCYNAGCKRYRLDDDYCESYNMFFENCISDLIDISKLYKFK